MPTPREKIAKAAEDVLWSIAAQLEDIRNRSARYYEDKRYIEDRAAKAIDSLGDVMSYLQILKRL